MHNALPMLVLMNYACTCALHNNATSKTMIMVIINGQCHYHGPYLILRISYREFLLTDPPPKQEPFFVLIPKMPPNPGTAGPPSLTDDFCDSDLFTLPYVIFATESHRRGGLSPLWIELWMFRNQWWTRFLSDPNVCVLACKSQQWYLMPAEL